MPKGIRSYKKYVEAALLLTPIREEDYLGLTRWLPAPDRGFEAEASCEGEYHAEIASSVSPAEPGTFLLRQFDLPEKMRHGA